MRVTQYVLLGETTQQEELRFAALCVMTCGMSVMPESSADNLEYHHSVSFHIINHFPNVLNNLNI